MFVKFPRTIIAPRLNSINDAGREDNVSGDLGSWGTAVVFHNVARQTAELAPSLYCHVASHVALAEIFYTPALFNETRNR